MNWKQSAPKILALMMFLTSCGGNREPVIEYIYGSDAPQIIEGSRPDEDQNPFDNEGLYMDPELDIDGVIDEEYLSPQGSGKIEVFLGGNEDTYVYLYKGEKAIYFIFEAKDDDISTLNLEDINLCTAQSDSVELYVDTYGMGGTKRNDNVHEFRMTANGKVYSYLTGFVSKVFLHGTNNNHKDTDEGFFIEGYISYTVLGADVDKYTPTSFAFARVTKTGNKGYVWHGEVDPQIPDNYKILHTDNKLYSLSECPMNAKIKGHVLDTDGKGVPGVMITANKTPTFTDSDGNYEILLTDETKDVELTYKKSEYCTYKKTISKQQLRMNRNGITANQTLLKENQKNYNTQLNGKITERDGMTPIEGVRVSLNDSFGFTNKDGKYSFNASCSGYENQVFFEEGAHNAYQTSLSFETIVPNGKTEVKNVQLDENFGDTLSFGNQNVGFAEARVVREAESFKLVMKTKEDMNPSDNPGSYFEVFVDTKTSACKDRRDDTDYRFDIECSGSGVINEVNYGAKKFIGTGITTKSGKINELSFVEADIRYEYLAVEPKEVFGLYFGIKHSYNWAGMYLNNQYVAAENPRNYYRLDENSKFFMGSSNIKPAIHDATVIDSLGEYGTSKETIRYNVSACRDVNGVTLIMENKSSIDFINQNHSLNVYFDMNYQLNKTKMDHSCGHITIYPGKPVSKYCSYSDTGVEDRTSDRYEETSKDVWTVQYGSTIYIYLNHDLFGGNENQTIGFTVGCWNDSVSQNDWLTYQGKQPDMNRPSSFIQVDMNGNIKIA